MEEKNKKKWLQPQLTVLVRRKPEEGILVVCKSTGYAVENSDFWYQCRANGCGDCDIHGDS